VYVDGGIRSARHVATALALGAQAVFVGRSALFALTLAGSEGVSRLLEELHADLIETLQLLGCGDVGQLRESGVLLGPPPPSPAG
jgi:4-hydroxymandelate oxidase